MSDYKSHGDKPIEFCGDQRRDRRPQPRRRLPPAPERRSVKRRREPGPDCPCAFCVSERDYEATAMWWLARGLRALAGIEQIRTAPRRN